MKKIILIVLGLSTFVFADFIKNGDIVTDTTTGLQWQDDVDVKHNLIYRWRMSIVYCKNLTLGGHDDWRLPNVNELISIVDRSKRSPAIADGFTNFPTYGSGYWSSTIKAGNDNYAWCVYIVTGYASPTWRYNDRHIRCVRGGK